jgi:hypothetical protein
MANTDDSPTPNEIPMIQDGPNSWTVHIDLSPIEQGNTVQPTPECSRQVAGGPVVIWESSDGEIVVLDESMVKTDTTVRPVPESRRKFLPPPYNGQPLPGRPPQDKPPT